MELLERDGEREILETAIAESRHVGRVVVVAGEAGIGKTSLVSAVASERHVLWGACDPLITPRPLGPLRDVARQAGGPLAAAVEDGSREGVLHAALDELAVASLLVVEDLHWADDATLDLVALLGRRLLRSPGCLVLTTRPEARPEVRRVLTTLPRECVRRVEPRVLSADAVAELARRAGRDAERLHAISGGNPFFVTELLASSAQDGVPANVRDAVALRVEALSPAARDAVERAAVVPSAAELWLVSDDPEPVDECIAAGLLHLDGEAVAFRHDLARQAVEEGISPVRRRMLDRDVLAALEAHGRVDPARLAHHARRWGDVAAIRRLAPAAARAASADRGHRESLAQWEAALATYGDERSEGRIEALEGVSEEGYLCGWPQRAIEARRILVDLRADDPLRHGDDLRWLSRHLWWAGRGPEAAEVGERAIAVLEAFPESRELAMALSAHSQLAMLAEDHQQAITLGERAAALARTLGDDEILTHALTNVGTSMLGRIDHERGRDILEEAHQLALSRGWEDHAARALVNRAAVVMGRRRQDPRIPADLERALRFVRENELDGYLQYLLGIRANLWLAMGDWRAAESDARTSIAMGEQRGVSQCPAMITIGRLQSRRGDPDARVTLDEAWRLAVETQELQRLAPAAVARAEDAFYEGELRDGPAYEAASDAYVLADERGDPWGRAELAFWLRRAGATVPPHPDDPEPFARAAEGDWHGAAAAFGRLGFTFDAAAALSEAPEEEARIEALAAFDGFGAARVAAHLRRRLRADGVRRIPRGPRAASREAPAGLTPRETEVLELLAEGATNAEIARALVISPKTVDHHVSAVLGKLGVASRREAGAAYLRNA